MSTVVELSDDRSVMTIRVDDIRMVTFRTKDEGGFTDKAVQMARDFDYSNAAEVQPGQRRVSRLKRLFGTPVYIHIHTGPPTWWLPRAEVSIRKRRFMVGWLRGLVAVAVDRTKGGDHG